jgi:hypothetical protein
MFDDKTLNFTNLFKRIGTLASTVGCVFALSLHATALPLQTKTPAHQKPDWEEKIVPGSQLTVLELARRIIPGIKADTGNDKITGSDLSRIRLLDGVEETGMELDRDSAQECEITGPDYFWMKDGGDRLLVLILKVNVEGVVIGVFKASSQVALLDAVTIAQDVHVDVGVEKLWAIHARHQAFVVQCWHDNSSESFDNYTFISIVNGKLRAVAGPVVSSGFATYSAVRQRVCKTSTTPKFQFARSAGPGSPGYFDLIVTEMTLKVCHRESEDWNWKTGIVSQKTVRRIWRWSEKNKQYTQVRAPVLWLSGDERVGAAQCGRLRVTAHTYSFSGLGRTRGSAPTTSQASMNPYGRLALDERRSGQTRNLQIALLFSRRRDGREPSPIGLLSKHQRTSRLFLRGVQ